MASKPLPKDLVLDYMQLPISRAEAKAQIAALNRHLKYSAVELHAFYLRAMSEQHGGQLKAWERNEDVPGPEKFE